MKRFAQLFLLLICFGLMNAQEIHHFRNDHQQGLRVESSTSTALQLHYALSEIGIADIDYGEAKGQEITLKGSFGSFAEGLPNLPSENRYVAVPKGASVSVTIKENGSNLLSGIDLLPAAKVIGNAYEGLPKLQKDMSVFGKDANFPSENVSIIQTTQIRGLDVALLSITPFRYNPVRKSLEIIYDMDIDIRFDGGNGQFGEARYRNPAWDGILRDLVVNSDMLPEAHYYELVSKVVNEREEGCEYLIISPDDEEVLAWADTLKRYRTLQGILTKVVTTTECGGNTTEAIKNYIQNAYEHWEIPPAAVMLFSGYEDYPETSGIPGFPLVFYNYDGTNHDYDYYSDNLYSDMNGDTIPDLAISRLPALDIDDYATEINKIIQYEKNPPTHPNYYNQPIITSGYEYNKWFLITSQAVNGFFLNKLGKQPKNYYMLYESTSGPVAIPDTAWSTGENTAAVVDYFGPNGQNYIAQCPDSLHDWRSMRDYSYLLESLNQGSFLTLYRDHSGSDLWCCPWIPSWDLNRLLNDTVPTFVLSIGCHTAEYLIGYAHIFNPPIIASLCRREAGALGGIGATTVTHSHYNDILTWGVIDHFWPSYMPDLGTSSPPDFTRPAYALVAGKLFLNQFVFMPNWWPKKVPDTHNVFHYLGEAYLNLYTEVPQTMSIEASLFSDDQTNYTIKAEKGATVCLSSHDNILTVAKATGKSQTITMPHQPTGEKILVTVTKQNRFCYQQEATVISSSQPYVYTKEIHLCDQNENGQLDYGEYADIDVTLHNQTQISSQTGSIHLLCDSPYIEIIQGSAQYTPIRPNATTTLTKAFRVKLTDDVPDQKRISFQVKFNEGENTHEDKLLIIANAPILNINPDFHLTSADGEPSTHINTEGKTSITFSIRNTGHSSIDYLTASYHVKAPFVEVEIPTQQYQSLNPDEEVSFSYELNTTPNTVTGAWLQSQFEVQYRNLHVHADTIVQYGGIFEDFEDDELNPYFKWTNNSAHKWESCADDFHNGQFCFMANASTTMASTVRAQLISDYIEHPAKLSFYYKTDQADTLQYFNSVNDPKDLFSSKDWHYAEVDFNNYDRYFIWSYQIHDDNDVQAKIDDICFPPLHTVIAYAGADITACDDSPVELKNAYAYDCDAIRWTTEGDGHFENDHLTNPVYYPGSIDLTNGNVTLTMTVYGNDTVVSSTQINFTESSSLGTIWGDSIVNKYKQPISHYSIDTPLGTHYFWKLEPSEAGSIHCFGNDIDIVWNLHEGDAEVTLSVSAENGCSTEPSIKYISLVGNATDEWHPVSFDLYPNPTDGKINLRVNEPVQDKATVEVYNILGEQMLAKTIDHQPEGGVLVLDLSRLPQGLYLVRLNTKNGTFSKKVSLK